MAPLIVGLIACWLLGSLFAGRFALASLAPADRSAHPAWGKPWVRFMTAFLAWPLVLCFAAVFAAFITFFFWDLMLYGPEMLDDTEGSA